jgi:hypothetical protein
VPSKGEISDEIASLEKASPEWLKPRPGAGRGWKRPSLIAGDDFGRIGKLPLASPEEFPSKPRNIYCGHDSPYGRI